jgi:hypothetical protein
LHIISLAGFITRPQAEIKSALRFMTSKRTAMVTSVSRADQAGRA